MLWHERPISGSSLLINIVPIFQKKKTLEVRKSRCYAEHKAPQHRTSQWIKVDSFKPMLYTNTDI